MTLEGKSRRRRPQYHRGSAATAGRRSASSRRRTTMELPACRANSRPGERFAPFVRRSRAAASRATASTHVAPRRSASGARYRGNRFS
jgi:hypothetical protein